ncbi:MAG: hypothetical protein NWP80_00060, partial [Candidatus Gracilibacteria bacterium]|nr:hypothetical protein [Candidatus Gracilibacteria bacterium]
MQNYTKIQKYISSTLILSILLSFTLNIPTIGIINSIFASDSLNEQTVTIFVENKVYSSLRSDIFKYANNITKSLDSTKTLIVPIYEDTQPYDIIKFNQRIYSQGFDGYNNLVGSVFIGNIPLPVVQNSQNSQKTVFPYVDLDDPLYIFDEINNIFRLNENIKGDPKAEIWHGFISTIIGDGETDITKIKQYLQKNDDFYNASGLFSGKQSPNYDISENKNYSEDYKPSVFYYDQLREFSALSYINYKAYMTGLEYLEDIAYNRLSKTLVSSLKNSFDNSQKETLNNIETIFNGQFTIDGMGKSLEFENVPDIQLASLVKNYSKVFLEVFNKDIIGLFRKNINDSGRYNEGNSKIGVDLIPSIVTNLDVYYMTLIKSANTDLENYINNLVSNGLSRKIAIPTKYNFKEGSCIEDTYINFYSGLEAQNITNPIECSIYRGSLENLGNLVEANRGLNVNNAQNDSQISPKAETSGYWGGNSPLNLDTNSIQKPPYELKLNSNADLNKSIVKVFDITGTKKITNSSKTPSIDFCLSNNLIKTNSKNYVTIESGDDSREECRTLLNVPINGGNRIAWNENSVNQNFSKDLKFDNIFTQLYTKKTNSNCFNQNIFIGNNLVKNVLGNCLYSSDETPPDPEIENFYYKTIPSALINTSPTSDELSKQSQNMVSPSLPLTKDRYIEFLGANNTKQKIYYPYLFRLKPETNETLTREFIKNEIIKYLNEKSNQINQIIQNSDPKNLSGVNREIYNLLKTGEFPKNISLAEFILNKSSENITNDGDSKQVTYVDNLVEAIYWNNLNSITSKYSYVFENYLSYQFQNKETKNFLPRNKKAYEIAYIGAAGNSKSMFIKMDAEEKSQNPYADILLANQEQKSKLLADSLNIKK